MRGTLSSPIPPFPRCPTTRHDHHRSSGFHADFGLGRTGFARHPAAHRSRRTEAEQQTIVSQEVQNLIEGMLANPTLSADTASGSKGWTKKSYAAYINRENPSGTISANSTSMSKQALADVQINEFRQALDNRLPNTNASSTICIDSSGAAPTASGTIKWNCDENGATTMVKVIWQVTTDNNNASGITMNGDRAVYTYQARITD